MREKRRYQQGLDNDEERTKGDYGIFCLGGIPMSVLKRRITAQRKERTRMKYGHQIDKSRKKKRKKRGEVQKRDAAVGGRERGKPMGAGERTQKTGGG